MKAFGEPVVAIRRLHKLALFVRRYLRIVLELGLCAGLSIWDGVQYLDSSVRGDPVRTDS
jgi:hypothetical protein